MSEGYNNSKSPYVTLFRLCSLKILGRYVAWSASSTESSWYGLTGKSEINHSRPLIPSRPNDVVRLDVAMKDRLRMQVC